MIVRELLTRLGFRIDDRNINIYNTTINNIHNNAERAAASVQGLFAALASFAALGAIAKVADETQSLEARIGDLPQTITSAADAFDVVAERATASRQSINAYANFYIKLQHAGKDFIKTQEDGLKVTDAISKALVLGGATAAEQGSALLQFGQAIGSGVLQGDEFRALTESAPQLVDAISQNLGIARADLKKFASEGKLTSKMVVQSVMEIADSFDQRFRNMPLTITQATTIIGNRWATFINRMNRESGAVTSIANFFLKGFDSIEVGLARLVDFFGGATNTLKFFGIALAAALAPLVFNAAAAAIGTLLSPVGLLFAGLVALGLAIEDFYNWMNGGESVFRKWFGPFDQAMAKLKEYQLVIDAVKIAVLSAVGVMVANWLWAAGVAAYTAGWTAAIWLINLARFTAALLANAVAVGTWVASLLASVATMVAGWIASFVSMAIAAAPVVLTIAGIVAAVALIVGAIYFLLDNWKTVFSLLKNIATLNFDGISDDFSKMVDKLKGYWNSFKSFFGMKVSTDIEANGKPVMQRPQIPIGPTPSQLVTPATLAGAATAPAGVPMMAGQGAPVTVTVNQTLPPGTPQETADAAKAGAERAFDGVDRLARQLGQVGG